MPILLKALLGLAIAAALPHSAAAKTETIYVGSHGAQVHAASFDAVTGELALIGPVADNPRPTWSVRHPSLPLLYVVNNTGGDGKSEGTIQTFRIERKTGALTKLGEMGAGGGGTTYLFVDVGSMTLFAANFAGSVSTLPIARDGSLGKPISVVAVVGSGPHRRQAGAHAHSVVLAPGGKFALVPDLGSDRVWTLAFDSKTRGLSASDPLDTRHYRTAPGGGPRHLAIHPGGRFVYLVDELTASLEVLSWDVQAGQLSPVQSLSTDAPNYTGDRSASEVSISRDGRFVYVANRGDHALAVYSVDRRNGKLNLVQRISSGGTLPWHFAVHPSGKWLLVANRDSNALTLFRVDRATGMLINSGKSLTMPKPVHVLFSGV